MTVHSGPLGLAGYREVVGLAQPFRPEAPPAAADRLDELAAEVLRRLDPAATGAARPALRALLTERGPGPLPPGVAPLLDALLGGESAQRPVVEVDALLSVGEAYPGTGYPAARHTALWRGDLTTLRAEAIVNAANSALLGCFIPGHPCVDNAIHTAAGPRLREDCHAIMSAQRTVEPVGTAKITRGYHLPARYVLHTVGPTVGDPLREQALAASYRSCLELAAEVGARTIGFCGISTGIFGFPKAPAARIALGTVADWLAANPGRLDRVVFSTFGAEDDRAYRELLSGWPG